MYRGLRRLVVCAGLLSAVVFAQSKAQDRITSAIDGSESVVLRGSTHPLAQPQYDQGRVNGNTVVHGVSLVFEPSSIQQASLQKLLIEQQTPSSASYHKWLSPEQYADRFGLTEDDVAKVTSWLESEGFTIDRVARSRTQISFTGSVARIESTFKTEIHSYEVNGEMHWANAGDLSVPAGLADVVSMVRNLSDFRPKPRLRRSSPRFTSSMTGNHFLAPADFATIYDLNSLYDLGIDGTGQKIAVVGDSSVTLSNIATFRSLAGLAVNNPTEILVSGTGTATVPSADEQIEAYLDLEWSGAIAKNAAIYYVYVGNNSNSSVWDALQYAVDQDTAPVISISFGYCESGLGQSFADTVQGWAQQANSQGQTIVSASGDAGAADCDTGAVATQGYAVDVPAAVPEVTGMGGSEFTGDTEGIPGPYWSATDSSTYGSALSYIPEEVWNDTAQNGSLSASGGGKSIYFAKPSWQTGRGVPSDGQRDVPDLALNASPDHDPYLICDGTTETGTQACTNGFRNSSNDLDIVGGTSAAAPTFAGIVALINQASASSGQGNINPTLYSLATSTASAFHDVTSGNNIVPCTQGKPSCPTTAPFQFGFSAGTGYDQASGLGSIDVYNLATAWPNYAGSYSLSSTAAAVSSAGGTGTSTVTVTDAGSFAGTVALTCSVNNATLACSLSPASVTLSASASSSTSTLTITTTSANVVPGKSAASSRRGWTWFGEAAGTVFAGFFVIAVPTRKSRRVAMLMVVLFACTFASTACGGGGSGSTSSSSTGSSTGTPAGTYTVTITGTSGSLTKTSTTTVTVN